MANYSDEDDFDSLSEAEDTFDFDLSRPPLEVNVSRKGSTAPSLEEDNASSIIRESELDVDDVELHGHRQRMKLSNKPPEVLLRQYQNSIALSLRQGKVGQ